jgi:alpha-ketoglutarate-dependent taurine dioxygenase
VHTDHWIKPKIGSRILNSKQELLSGELAADIRDLLERRGVLVFPKINFTEDEQIAFTRTLGSFAPEGEGNEGVTRITLDVKENPSSAEYLKGSLYWHIDGTRNDVPILASLLSCKVPSPKGTGNTGFSNTYAAYDDLPAHRVFGVDALKSAELIHGLREWATGEEFTYSHEWSVGDMVIRDNTGTMHRAKAYDTDCGLMMLRTKPIGYVPDNSQQIFLSISAISSPSSAKNRPAAARIARSLSEKR